MKENEAGSNEHGLYFVVGIGLLGVIVGTFIFPLVGLPAVVAAPLGITATAILSYPWYRKIAMREGREPPGFSQWSLVWVLAGVAAGTLGWLVRTLFER